ncbi:heme o synthase [Halobacteriovorax sp. HLS]|uniref:heme o synthase n=1 Tax=Halobacteriovorax sp. HLS TaxID=2234000 RepID=UPI000FD6DE54|nr:heme o synthase [Halobacteriovorax sp. HLS]
MKLILSLTIFLTYLLIILGGLVHNTGSALSCPDWPLCYGELVNTTSQGSFLEQMHRVIASLIGFFSMGVFIKCRSYKKSHPRLYRFSLATFMLVLFQGGLGLSTFLYKLPTLISTTHLAFSLIFFCCLLSLKNEWKLIFEGNFLSSDDKTALQKTYNPMIRDGIFFSISIVAIQVFLGAVMRHSGAGNICGLGTSIFQCFERETTQILYWSLNPKVQINLVHRYVALLAFVVVVWNGMRVFLMAMRTNTLSKDLRVSILLHSASLIFLIILQAISGAIVSKSNISVFPTTFHLASACLIIWNLWSLRNRVRNLELNLFGEVRHTFVSDVLEITKLRLGTLVVITIAVGIFAAPGNINFFKAILSLVLMTMVVCAATTLNCYIERDVDKNMERTKNRALPSGRMKPGVALFIGYSLLAIALPLLVIFVNWPTMILSLIAAVLYLFAYTPMKLKSEAALFVGAIPGAIPPVMGWTTVTGKIDAMSVALFSILFIWQIPHFLAIAMYHAKDYDAANIKVYPNKIGFSKSKRDIFLYTIILVLVSLSPYWIGFSSVTYRNIASVCGISFLILSSFGFFIKDHDAVLSWARTYFWASIIYLPLLLISLIFFN